MFDNWHCYSKFLSSAKVLLISTRKDTFNYTIMDAIKCKCVPLAPRSLCFPEILDDEYLYSTIEELIKKIKEVLSGELGTPKRMICHSLVDNFYQNVAFKMKEN